MTPAGSGVATGIGGVFMRAKDAKKLRTWYAQHLGLPLSPYSFVPLRWRELDDPFHVATTVWATFKPESTHFAGPSCAQRGRGSLPGVLEPEAEELLGPATPVICGPLTRRFAHLTIGDRLHPVLGEQPLRRNHRENPSGLDNFPSNNVMIQSNNVMIQIS